jgi:hypothetical protein
MKAFWADWKAKGKPPIVRGCIRVGQPKRLPVASTSRPSAFWKETDAERKARIAREVQERWPDKGF